MAARRSEKLGFQVVVPYRRSLGRDIMKGHGGPFSNPSRSLSFAFGTTLSVPRTATTGRHPKPLCGRSPLRKDFLQLGRVWSIAVMCPALMCGHVDRGPRWVTRIGPQTSRRGLRPKGFPGVFRSSVRPIAILLLSSQTPGQNEVSELFRLGRKRPAINLTAHHHGPERPSHLVGQRDCRKLLRLAR